LLIKVENELLSLIKSLQKKQNEGDWKIDFNMEYIEILDILVEKV
jgi:hypothetical protein